MSAVVSYDLSDYGLALLDARRTKVYAKTNIPGETITDDEGIHVGSANGTVNSDGTGSITIVTPEVGSNPETWQTTVYLDYPDRNAPGGRKVRTFGPFTVTVDVDLKDLVEEQEIPPEYLTTVTEELQTYVDEAEAAAALAVDISNIEVPDDVMQTIDNNPASAFRIQHDAREKTTFAIRTHYLDTDYATLELALTALPDYATLEIRGVHTRTATFTVDQPCTIRWAVGGEITVTSSNTDGITVTSDYVTIVDPNITGDGLENITSDGIKAVGTAADPIDHLAIIGTGVNWASISGMSAHGILTEHTTNLTIDNVVVDDCAYAGIMLLSALDFRVENNRISNITRAGGGLILAYGIAISRDSTVSLAVAPLSGRGQVNDNVVTGVPTWEGFDTHGGFDITYARNKAYGCKTGFAMVTALNTSGVSTYAPQNVKLLDNHADSQVTDGSASAGYIFTGAGTANSVVQYATGEIRGNTAVGHGEDSSALGAGYQFYVTKGLVVSNNRAVGCSRSGYLAYYQNVGTAMSGNVAEDVWTNAGATAAFLNVADIHNTIKLSGNVLVRGTKTATVVNSRGLTVGTPTGNVIVDQGNDFLAATQPYAGTGLTDGIVRFDQRGIVSGYVGSTPVRGVWQTGAQALKTAPTASTSPGWICTTAGGANSAAWVADTATTAGTWIRSTAGNRVFEAIVVAGDTKTDPTTEPAWSAAAVGDTFVDDQVTWICRATTLAVFKTMAVLGA